jgi:hypothetical protein
MSKRAFLSFSAISLFSALFGAGCFFGGEDDSSLPIVEEPKTNDTLPKVRRIVPGLYTGDYSWIDSGRTGLESEFLLDTNGAYRLFWISRNEAVYDQHGAWIQKDSLFFFSRTEEAWRDGGVFSYYSGMDDDTNTVRNVTDSGFVRREWTPLRQKPYWISYHRLTYPKLREGVYTHTESFTSTTDSIVDTVVYDLSIELKAGKLVMTVNQDSQPYYQADAKYNQVGSFLVTDENRNRQADSTRIYSEWFALEGSIMQRVRTISDTGFTLWNPSPSEFDTGNWDHYSKRAPTAPVAPVE